MKKQSDDEMLKSLSSEEVERLVAGEHSDPHKILGAHPVEGSAGRMIVIRAFHPDAEAAEICLEEGQSIAMTRMHPEGLFAAALSDRPFPFSYRLRFRLPDGST